MKTCEEVWLGKVFDLQPHTGGLSRAQSTEIEAGSEIIGSDMMPHAVLQQTYEGSRFVICLTWGTTNRVVGKGGARSRFVSG